MGKPLYAYTHTKTKKIMKNSYSRDIFIGTIKSFKDCLDVANLTFFMYFRFEVIHHMLSPNENLKIIF